MQFPSDIVPKTGLSYNVMNYLTSLMLFTLVLVQLLFDHSCVSDIVIEDKLDVTKINSGYGGSKGKMRPTKIKQ